MTDDEKRTLWIALIAAGGGALLTVIVQSMFRPVQRVVVVEEPDA